MTRLETLTHLDNMEKTITLNEQQVNFLETLLAEEYIKDSESGIEPRSQTNLHIAYQLLTQLQDNE